MNSGWMIAEMSMKLPGHWHEMCLSCTRSWLSLTVIHLITLFVSFFDEFLSFRWCSLYSSQNDWLLTSILILPSPWWNPRTTKHGLISTRWTREFTRPRRQGLLRLIDVCLLRMFENELSQFLRRWAWVEEFGRREIMKMVGGRTHDVTSGRWIDLGIYEDNIWRQEFSMKHLGTTGYFKE